MLKETDIGEITLRVWSPDSDYPLISDWMLARVEVPPPRDFLPWSGFMVDVDGTPVAACFVLAYAHVPLGVIELMVSKPSLPMRIARRAMRHLFRFAGQCAKSDMGLAGVLAHTWSPAMEREAVKAGFTVSRKNGTLLWRKL